MNRYDPLRTPDPAQWLELDESERSRLVQQYHRRARIRLPNATLHAVFHVVVENQVAEGTETPVLETLARLMSAGLDRHQALHAIGSVLAGHVYEIIKGTAGRVDPSRAYLKEVEALTAEEWRRSGEDEWGDESRESP